MKNMWLLRILFIGALFFYNRLYSFLPKRLSEKRISKIIAVLIAIILCVLWITGEIINYKSYSYAEVSEEGKIVDSRNFNYVIKKTTVDKDKPAYIIMGKLNRSNLKITPYKAATVEIEKIGTGIKLVFVGSGFGDPIISTSFKVEIKKSILL